MRRVARGYCRARADNVKAERLLGRLGDVYCELGESHTYLRPALPEAAGVAGARELGTASSTLPARGGTASARFRGGGLRLTRTVPGRRWQEVLPTPGHRRDSR